MTYHSYERFSCSLLNFERLIYIFHRRKADAVDRLLASRLLKAKCLVKRQSVWRRIERDFLSGEVSPKPPEQLCSDAAPVIFAVYEKEADMALRDSDRQ